METVFEIISAMSIIKNLTMETVIETILAMGMVGIMISLFLLLDYKKRKAEKTNSVLLWTMIIVFAVLAIILIVMDGVEIGLESESWHLGWILGLPALVILTIGTLLVLYDEPKYVLYHGYFAGSSLILTILNVASLIYLSDQSWGGFSGLIHSIHLLCGMIGTGTGLASFLFGISGQRKLAKLTGYITVACWWGAFLLALFLPDLI